MFYYEHYYYYYSEERFILSNNHLNDKSFFGGNDDSVQCDLCNKWNHTRWLFIEAEQYEKLDKDPLPWYCPNCAMEILFSTLSNKGLKTVLFEASSKNSLKSFSKPFDKKTTKKLKTFCEVSQLFDQSEHSVSCDYYTLYELNKKTYLSYTSVFLHYLPILMTWKTFKVN